MAQIRPTGDAIPGDSELFFYRECGGALFDMFFDLAVELFQDRGGGNFPAVADHCGHVVEKLKSA